MGTLTEEKEKNTERETIRSGRRSIRGLVVVEDERKLQSGQGEVWCIEGFCWMGRF